MRRNEQGSDPLRDTEHRSRTEPASMMRERRSSHYRTALALMVLLAVTAWSGYLPLGRYSFPLAIAIATMKAVLILLFFMELKFEQGLVRLVAGTTFAWLSILFVLSLTDYLTRGVLQIAGK